MNLLYRIRRRLTRLRGSLSPRGPYRFLVGRWDRLRDFDLVVAAAGSDWYHTHLSLTELPLDRYRRVAVLAPHQDDEAIGAGGTMLRWRDMDVDVTIVLATDGVQTWRDQPDVDAGAVRDAELQKVADDVGATVEHVGISNPRPRPTAADVDRLAAILRDRKIELVLTPWLLDQPVKHRMVAHVLHLALERPGVAVDEVWGYQVHNEMFANGYVDITEQADGKRALLAHYASQMERYRRYDHIAMGAAAWNARLVPGKRAKGPTPMFEIFNALPAEEFVAAVERLYLPDLERVYGRGDLADHMATLR